MSEEPVSPRTGSSRRRYVILGLLFLSTLMNNLDRQTVAVLKPTLKKEFALDDAGYAWVINAFTLCYASAYMFSGWIVDRLGARRALPWFIGVWSLASAGCGVARNAAQLIFLRGLLGLAEPGNFPVALRAITIWFRPAQRGLATGFYNLGTIFSPLIIALIAVHAGWRAAFVAPAIIGLPLLVAWWLAYHERVPADDATLAAAPTPAAVPTLPQSAGLSWSQLWRTRSLWGLILARFISDPVMYFVLFWMPGYLQENRGLSLAAAGWVSWIPGLAANVGGLGAMMLSDRLIRRGAVPLAARKRVLIGLAALGLCAPFIPHLHHLGLTMLLFSAVAVLYASWLFGLVLIISDVYPAKNVGSVCGITGAVGAIGAAIFNQCTGHALTAFGVERIYLVLGLLHPLACLPLFFLVKREAAAR